MESKKSIIIISFLTILNISLSVESAAQQKSLLKKDFKKNIELLNQQKKEKETKIYNTLLQLIQNQKINRSAFNKEFHNIVKHKASINFNEAIILAAKYGKDFALKALLPYIEDVNAVVSNDPMDKKSNLLILAMKNQANKDYLPKIFGILLQWGIDIEYQNADGDSVISLLRNLLEYKVKDKKKEIADRMLTIFLNSEAFKKILEYNQKLKEELSQYLHKSGPQAPREIVDIIYSYAQK